MTQIIGISRGLPWLIAASLTGLVAACGGGGQSPILGAGSLVPVVAPIVTIVAPASGALGVAPNTNAITATFSKAMDAATLTGGNFTLTCAGAPAIDVGAVTYLAISKLATLPLLASLPASSVCTATVAALVQDSTGVSMANNHVWQFTTGPAIDNIPPTVTLTNPVDTATGIATNALIHATFSEAMDPITVNAANFTLANGLISVPGIVSINPLNDVATFTPSTPLTINTLYTATVVAGVTGVTDLAGNLLSPTNKVWTFTTAATNVVPVVAPIVTIVAPASGALGVASNTKAITAKFSKSMDAATLTGTSFTLACSGLSSVTVGTVTYLPTSNVATLPVLSPLPISSVCTATVTAAAKDSTGISMVSDHVWQFTTGAATDMTQPTVTLVNPADVAIDVSINTAVKATFSEAMDPNTVKAANFTLAQGVAPIAGTVSINPLNTIATFTPNASLTPNTLYTATIVSGATGVTDQAGNLLAPANKVWSFTTAATAVSQPPVTLNMVEPFGTFGGSAGMTNMGINTVINGDIGTIATGTSSITGFHDALNTYTQTPSNIGNVSGKIYTCTNSSSGANVAGPSAPDCAVATQARLDAQTAYLALEAMPAVGASPAPGANLAGITLQAGTYKAPGGSFMIQGGDLTLTGDANAVWVFQMASTLTVGGPGAAAPQNVILAGGALAKNVFWQVGTAATVNAGGGGTVVGTIIASNGVSFSTAGQVTPVTLNGRALSLGASVTMVNTVINVPAP